MSFSDFEKIDVDTPPPSPVPFLDAYIDVDIIPKVTSPVKRARSSLGTKGAKRRKKVAGDDITVRNEPDKFVLQETEPVEDSYTAYVCAVAEKRAGFYMRSEGMYVVRGWDDKLHSAKVCSTQICQPGLTGA